MEFSEDGLGNWIRVISNRESQELSIGEMLYDDGSTPALLDVMAVPVLEPKPENHQTENWILISGRSWRKIGRFNASDLEKYAKNKGLVWNVGAQSASGFNDRVAFREAKLKDHSLDLIQVDAVDLGVTRSASYQSHERISIQAFFRRGRHRYKLRVTDPVIEERYGSLAVGKEIPLGPCYLTVSLTENFHGFCYKLVAAVIECK